MGEQFSLRSPADEVEADHLVGAFGGLTARVECDQQAGDDGTLGLDLDAHRVGTQQIPAAEDLLEEAKEDLDRPVILPPKAQAFI